MKPTREIAEELGISYSLLNYHLTANPNAPMADLRKRGKQLLKYYDENEVIAWWRDGR